MGLVSDRLSSRKGNASSTQGITFRLVRVTSIILDDSHPAWKFKGGWDSLGTIFFVDPTKAYAQLVQPLEYKNLPSARPYFSNQKMYPLAGELILLVEGLMSKNLMNTNLRDDSGINYYLPHMNIWNHPHNNAFPQSFEIDNIEGGPSIKGYEATENGIILRKKTISDSVEIPLGNNFIEKPNIKPLLPYEGDIIFEGRFGNSIRFGATTAYNENNPNNKPNPWSNNSLGGKNTTDKSTEGVVGDPITIIRNGQPKEAQSGWIPLLENVNLDDSSIYMTSNQTISNLVVATATKGSPDKTNQNSYYQDLDSEGNSTKDEFAIVGDINSNAALVYGPLNEEGGYETGNEDDSYKSEPLSNFESANMLEVSESIFEEENLNFYDELKKTGMSDDDFESYEGEFNNTLVSGELDGINDDPTEESSAGSSTTDPLGETGEGWLYLKYLETEGGGRYPGGGKSLIYKVLGVPGYGSRTLKAIDKIRNKEWYQKAVGFFWGTDDVETIKEELKSKRNHITFPGIKGSITRIMIPMSWSDFNASRPTYMSHPGRRGGTSAIGIQRTGFGPIASNKKLLIVHVTAGSRGRTAYDVAYGHIVPTANEAGRFGSPTKNDRIGYHIFIMENGDIFKSYDDADISYGVIGTANGTSKGRQVPWADTVNEFERYNDISININIVGSNRWTSSYVPNSAQQYSLNKVVDLYMNVRYPKGKLTICGHNQLIPIGQGKTCPGFDVREYAKALGLQPNQIVPNEPKCFNNENDQPKKYKIENLEVYKDRGIAIANVLGENALAKITRVDGDTKV